MIKERLKNIIVVAIKQGVGAWVSTTLLSLPAGRQVHAKLKVQEDFQK